MARRVRIDCHGLPHAPSNEARRLGSDVCSEGRRSSPLRRQPGHPHEGPNEADELVGDRSVHDVCRLATPS